MSRRTIGWALIASGILAGAGATILSARFGWPARLDDPAAVALPAFVAESAAIRFGFALELVSSLLLVPATIAQFAGTAADGGTGTWLQRVATALSYGQPLHLVLYAALIIGFAFFYTALVFNARETADNLKKSGAFIPGIRPGQQTGEYIDKVLTRLTLWGALYIAAVCLLPEFVMASQGVPFQFGGTSLLILVVVVMDFASQLQAHAMSHQYPGLMKKANLLGGRNSGS